VKVTQGKVSDDGWVDEIHPDKKGFEKIAA